MAKRTNMMVPASWTGQDKRFAESIKETVDCLVGQRGDPLDKAVTVKDLLGSGLAVLPAGGPYSGVPNDLTTPPTDNSTPNLQTPPAPTSLTANGSFQNILLAWNLESYSGHSGVDVYRHTSDSISDATLIGRASGSQKIFSDSVGGNASFYYWVRAFNQNGSYGAYNSSSGTLGTTQPDVDFLLNELTDQITSTQLTTDLSTPISLISASESVTGSVAYQVAQESVARTAAILVESTARSNALITEATARTNAIGDEVDNRIAAISAEAQARTSAIEVETSARISAVSAETSARVAGIASEASSRQAAISASATALQNQINDLLDIEPYDASVSYVTNDQVTYLNKLYKALQNTTGNLPTDTVYWNLLGNYSSLGDLVGSNTSSITAINTVSATSSSAAAQAIHGLNSTINDPDTGLSATSSALESVETLVDHSETGVTASANKISALETTVDDPVTGVSATTSALEAVETLVNHSDTGVAASASKISALETTVDDPTTGMTATSGALETLETAVNDSETGLSATAGKVTALESTLNGDSGATPPVVGVATAFETLETAVNDSETGLSSVAGKVTALESTVNDETTGVVATSGALETLDTAVNDSETGLSVTSGKVTALENTINDETTGLSATSDAVDTLESAVNDSEDGLSATAEKVTALESTLNGDSTATPPVIGVSTALDELKILVEHTDTGVSASAQKISDLESTVDDPATGVTATSGALETLETAVNDSETGLSATAGKVTDLESTLDGDPNANPPVAGVASAFETLKTAVNDSDTGLSATADKVTDLESTLDGDPNATPPVIGVASGFETLKTAVNDSETGLSAVAGKVTLLETTLNGDSGATPPVQGLSTAFEALDSAVTDSDSGLSAVAGKVTDLESTVNDAEDGVVATAGALETLDTAVTDSETGLVATAGKVSALEVTLDGDPDAVPPVNGLSTNFNLLNNTVTDSETGLAATAESLSGLKVIVGNATSGLVQAVNLTANESSTTADDIDNLVASLNQANTDASGNPQTDTTLDAAIIRERQIRIDNEGSQASLIEGISSTLGNKTQTFFQDDVPTSLSVGDLWISALDDNKLYRATIVGADQIQAGEWVPVGDQTATTTTFAQNDIPTSGAVGDIWIDTNDKNTVYRAESVGADEVTTNEWVKLDLGQALATAGAVTDLQSEVFEDGGAGASKIEAIFAELDDPDTGTTTLATRLSQVFTDVRPTGEAGASSISLLSASIAAKPDTFFSQTAPTATAIGDLWINESDNNKLYRAESIGANEITSGEWVRVSDNSPTTTTFSDSEIPTSLNVGDLWINTGENNKLYRAESVGADEKVAGEWVHLDIGNAVANAGSLSELESAVYGTGEGAGASSSRIDTIFSELNNPATGESALAQSLTEIETEVFGDGAARNSRLDEVSLSVTQKPNTFAQASEPTATAIGDLWIDTTAGNNNKLYRNASLNPQNFVAVNDTTPTTKTFISNTVPTATTIGDLWVNTELRDPTEPDPDSEGNPNKPINHLYRAESADANEVTAGEWVFVDLGQAVSTAGVVNAIETEVFPNGSSSASSISQISAAINDVDGDGSNVTLQERFSAQADTNGDLEAQYSVKIDNNGAVSGFGLSSFPSSDSPTNTESAFIVNADKFAIIDPETEDDVTSLNPDVTTIPFGVSNGNVYIKSAFIENGSITTAQIGSATIDTARITGTLTADHIGVNTIAANSIDASMLNIDGSSITSVDVGGVPTLQIGDVNVNKLTGTEISASIMSGTSVFADKLTGDVNTLVPFRTFVIQQYGGSETTMIETELPASSHPDGHKPFAIATGYIQPRFERVYRFKMYMKTTTSTSTSLGNPNNAVFVFSNNQIYRYIDFTGDISGSVSSGYTLTSGSKTGTVTNVSIVSGNTRLYYSGSVAFATTDSITASSGTGYQLVGESRMKAATATKMSFAVSGSKADADAGTITMKVTVTQHNSSDTSLDNFTSTVFINEVSGMIMGVR